MLNDEIILVSVLCLSYNHEQYIEQTIKSFLMQKTTFNYEIIIHDDRSNDLSQKVIKKYEQMYPNRITAILQKENQYSKGISIIDDIMIPLAKGKYIALCEGDDYWTDENKLQKQVEMLEKNINCDVCAHAVNIFDMKKQKIIGTINSCKEKKIFSLQEVVDGGGNFVGTNSLMIRKSYWNNLFEARKIYPLDYILQITSSISGGMAFVPEVMSVYRFGTCGSWTDRMRKNPDSFAIHYKRLNEAILSLDNETNERFHDILYNEICYTKYMQLRLERRYKDLINADNKDIWNSVSRKDKIVLYLKYYLPLIDKFLDWRRNGK